MKRLILSLALLAAGLANAQTDTKYMFPARDEDLPDGAYWWLGGPHAGHPTPKDIVGVRWDGDADEWTAHTGTEAEYNAKPTADKHVIYGVPVYAPSDGTIVSCWRNFPEESGDPSGRHPEYPARILTGGNHVRIRTPQGHFIDLLHFQPDSVPPELCPIEDEFLCDDEKPEDGCRKDGSLEPHEQTTVKKGQLVGRVGDTGNSSGPHLHLQIMDDNGGEAGVSWEYPFSRTWVQTTTDTTALEPNSWVRVSGEALNANPKLLIHPDPLLRRGTLDVDGANRRAAASHLGYVVTAKQNLSDQLRVSSFGVNDAGEVNLVMTDFGGAISAVDVASTGLHPEFGVGVRDSSGRLKVIYYGIDANGILDRQDSGSGPPIGKRLAMDGLAHLGLDRGVVVATTPSNSNTLIVYAYKVIQTQGADTPDDDTDDLWGFEAVGAGIGDSMSATGYPDITTLENARAPGEEDSFRGAVTAVVDDTGSLKLESFRIESNLSVFGAGTLRGGGARKVFIETVRLDSDRQIVVVAMQLATNQLKVATYQVDAAGEITPIDSSTEGPISDLSLFAADPRHVVTPVRNDAGNLEVLTWEVQDDGTIRRVGTVAGGSVETQLSGATVFTGGRRFAVTALSLRDSMSRLIAWEANLH